MEIKKVTGGFISGAKSADGLIEIYRGIPYAMPPAGDYRWQAPQPVIAWDGVKVCEQFGANAIQEHGVFDQPWMAPFTQEFWSIDSLGYSEDCLTLNVWTAAKKGDKLPVVVYIHGGGFGGGAGSIPVYDGENMARHDVVYVSINYRVGLLGFLTNEKLNQESANGISGNYGILDQIQALKWVQENIAEFGGDKDNVTISGQSAGGASVLILMTSPLAEGLFKNAFPMSFTYLDIDFMKTQREFEEKSNEFFKDMTLEQMRALSPDEVLAIHVLSSACVDGVVIPKFVPELLAEGINNAQNVLTGMVTGDSLFEAMNIGNTIMPLTELSSQIYEEAVAKKFGELAEDCLAAYPTNGAAVTAYQQLNSDSINFNQYFLCKRMMKKSETQVYQYSFNHKLFGPDGEDFGAFHTADVPFWLGNLDFLVPARKARLTSDDYELSRKMMTYFLNFAKTGNPNGEGLVKWCLSDEAVVNHFYIGDNDFTTEGYNYNKIKFWTKYYSSLPH